METCNICNSDCPEHVDKNGQWQCRFERFCYGLLIAIIRKQYYKAEDMLLDEYIQNGLSDSKNKTLARLADEQLDAEECYRLIEISRTVNSRYLSVLGNQ